MMRLKKWMALFPLVAGLAACDDFGWSGSNGEPGVLYWCVDGDAHTKAPADLPDTNDFLLTILDAKGKALYDGTYGDSPASLQVDAGTYTVRIVSLPFSTPAFDRPQYGDEQVVVVPAGKSVSVNLQCSLLNAGVRLQTSSDFLENYPDGVLYLKQAGTRLMYSYSERRIAYFQPGEVSLILYNQGKDQTLLTRSLSARDILTLRISAPAKGGSGRISVSVDTLRNWRSETYTIGGSNSGSGNDGSADIQALSVSEAKDHAGESGVWVYGYIVGGDLTSSGKSVKTSGITKSTHLALATRSSVTDKASCVAVELPAGKVREALNLVDHPDLVGCRVYVKGNLVESYFGTTGLKGTSDYTLK